MAVLGLCCSTQALLFAVRGLSIVETSRSCSLAAASHCGGFSCGAQAPGRGGFSSCGAQALEHVGVNSCGS